MSPLIALRERGLGTRSGAAALSRSSVARSASSRALSSDACVETRRFLEVVSVNISAVTCRSRKQGRGGILLVNCSIKVCDAVVHLE